MSQKHIKRLIAEIPLEIHNEIKKKAIFHNISLRKWVLQAIMEKITKEEQYQ